MNPCNLSHCIFGSFAGEAPDGGKIGIDTNTSSIVLNQSPRPNDTFLALRNRNCTSLSFQLLAGLRLAPGRKEFIYFNISWVSIGCFTL